MKRIYKIILSLIMTAGMAIPLAKNALAVNDNNLDYTQYQITASNDSPAVGDQVTLRLQVLEPSTNTYVDMPCFRDDTSSSYADWYYFDTSANKMVEIQMNTPCVTYTYNGYKEIDVLIAANFNSNADNTGNGRHLTVDAVYRFNDSISTTDTTSDASSAPSADTTKRGNSISIKSKSSTVSYKKLKKGKFSFKLSATAKTAITYKKVSGSSRLSLSSKGTVTIKKGTKKGNYSIRVKVTAKENEKYKKNGKTYTYKVTVK